MNDNAAEAMLSRIRKGLGRGKLDRERQAALASRLERPPRGTVPACAQGDAPALLERFVENARAVQATVDVVDEAAAVLQCVHGYLENHDAPLVLRASQDSVIAGLPWSDEPRLDLRTGRADRDDAASLVGAVAGVAETGTLMIQSGPDAPSSLNFLPDIHIVVLPAARIVGSYEDAFDRLRNISGRGVLLPRTVNFITGPSRSGDIGLTLALGAHGPRQLHIIVVTDWVL